MIPSGISEPKAPISIPSITNGALTKKSVAPMYFIMLISSLRTEIPIVTVLLIKNIDTAKRIAIIPIEILTSLKNKFKK